MAFEISDQLWTAGERLLVAVALAVPLGLERERKERPAGLRTHVLVCLGATLLVVVSEYLARDVIGDGARLDRTRIAAGIITGIGFLGAGTIFTVGSDQHGLTTAAMIWFVAALGVAVGAGYLQLAAFATVLVLVTVIGLEQLERLLPAKHRPYRLKLSMPGAAESIADIEKLIRDQGISAEIARVTFKDGGRVAEVVYTIVARRGKDIAQLARTISEHYERVENIVIDR